MIDNLNLTIYESPDVGYLEVYGDIRDDENRRFHYKHFCELDKAQVSWRPHKYGEETNFKFSYCRAVINPKNFDSFNAFYIYLMRIFELNLELGDFNISRIDIASDIRELPFDVAISRLYAMGFRRDGISLYKGSTLYIGKNPLIRVYDKRKEVKARLKKGKDVTDYEKGLVESNDEVTRFEIEIRPSGLSLKDVVDDPAALASHFDRFRFYNFEDEGKIASLGGLQFLMSQMRREKKAAFERYKDSDLEILVKESFISSVASWFKGAKSKDYDEVPF